MNEWMTVKDLSEYLEIPKSRIRSLINEEIIPFHNNHGFLRFNRQEIDYWMKTPSPKQEMGSDTLGGKGGGEGNGQEYAYRGRPIKNYKLTASRVLIIESAWMRLPDFIKKTVTEANKRGRDYLYREEFKPFLPNFNDYLRISCQFGLIENVGNEEQDERRKRYYVSTYAQSISADPQNIRRIILDSILNIVKGHREVRPHEKHAILLLWYFLKLKCSGVEPHKDHFRKPDKPHNSYPSIRLGFAKSLCYFLLADDMNEQRQVLSQWEQNM